jgi:competence protein ComEC
MSLVVFVGFNGTYLALTGDLEKPGWEAMLGNQRFRDYLSKTTILLAPHHGREAGICSEAFDLMSPMLCVISDGPSSDTSSSVYSELASGAKVLQGGSLISRRALSTRKDGTVQISIGQREWKVEID